MFCARHGNAEGTCSHRTVLAAGEPGTTGGRTKPFLFRRIVGNLEKRYEESKKLKLHGCCFQLENAKGIKGFPRPSHIL